MRSTLATQRQIRSIQLLVSSDCPDWEVNRGNLLHPVDAEGPWCCCRELSEIGFTSHVIERFHGSPWVVAYGSALHRGLSSMSSNSSKTLNDPVPATRITACEFLAETSFPLLLWPMHVLTRVGWQDGRAIHSIVPVSFLAHEPKHRDCSRRGATDGGSDIRTSVLRVCESAHRQARARHYP